MAWRRQGLCVAACFTLAACTGLAERSEERACRDGIVQLEAAIAAWQGGINARTEAENQLDFADGAADFRLWDGCRSSLRRGFRALGQAP